MSWNHRHAGNWQTSTVKRRKNGQWVTISSGNGSNNDDGVGGIPSRFYTDGPPERSGTTITYNESYNGSLQDAHDELSSGDTLYIDPSDSPYVERLQVTTDNVTIESDGAWLEQPDATQKYVIRIGEHQGGGHGFHPEETTLSGSHDGGEVTDVVNVSDASVFSVGDDIFIEESRRPFGEPQSGGASGADTTHEYKTVTSVNTSDNSLRVHHPLFMPYPNTSNTAVGRMDWAVEDVSVIGVNLRGISEESYNTPLQVTGARDVWVDTIEIEDAYDENIHSQWNFNQTYRNIVMRNGADYGIDIARSSTQTLLTDIIGDGIGHYVVRFGPGGGRAGNSVDGIIDGITGRNFSHSGPVANAHWGGFYVRYSNLTGDGVRSWRTRSRHVHLDGGREESATRGSFTTRQRPFNCSVKNFNIVNKSSGVVFNFNLREDYNEEAGDLLFENIDIEPYDRKDITQIGQFNTDSGGCTINGLTFRNVTYAGQQLTRSDVEEWPGYNDSATNITDLAVE